MVQVIVSRLADHEDYGGGQPLIHIHHVARDVHGNGIAIRVYGEMKIAAKEVVFAKELKLNTLQVLTLTPEVDVALGKAYIPQKWVYHKGEYDNYASIDVFYIPGGSAENAEITAGDTDAPSDGSIWLDFIALGE